MNSGLLRGNFQSRLIRNNQGFNKRSSSQSESGPGIHRVLLTGGPCAGKTTMMAKLTSVLDNKGYRVFNVPEAATLLGLGGIQLDARNMGWDYAVQMQSALLVMQMNIEDAFTDIALAEQAQTQKPTLIMCDRGVLDGSAYCSPEMWHQIMDDCGYNGVNLIEKRYEAIVHMVTAAEGAKEFYDLSNEARFETVEEAIARDQKLRQAYLGHQKHLIVDNNSSSFESKMKKTIGLISSVVGLPTDQMVFRKYLVTGDTPMQLPDDIQAEKMKILETYLNAPQHELDDTSKQNLSVCVRKRTKQGIIHHKYEKRYSRGGERIQEMRSINAKDYLAFLENKSDEKEPLLKERVCFVYKTQSFILENYTDVPGQPTVLRVETSNKTVDLPPFIDIEREITNERAYSSASLASLKRAK